MDVGQKLVVGLKPSESEAEAELSGAGGRRARACGVGPNMPINTYLNPYNTHVYIKELRLLLFFDVILIKINSTYFPPLLDW